MAHGVHLTGFLLVITAVLTFVAGHGRLVKPVGRATMWRQGYKTPPDYNDHQLYCGGRGHQWNMEGGKCGVCGDPYDQRQPRDHEAGGKYGLGIIVERYNQGQIIQADVVLTANHGGNFEFRICDTNNPKVIATEECLNRNLLSDINGKTKFYVTAGREFSFKLMLSPYLTCSHCVFQWKYEAAQNPGNQQEHFINCADVAIDARNQPYIPTITNTPYVPPTRKPYIPPVTYKPYIPPVTYKPYIPPVTYKPYIPPVTYKPYIPPVTYKPYIPPPPNPGTQKPIFPHPYVPPYVPPTQRPTPNKPTLMVKCPPGCNFYCQISIRLCPLICRKCYTVAT